jgi:hypothetical protein
MTFLPIVARELRVASGKFRSHWMRLFMAVTGMLVLGFTLEIARLGRRGSSTQVFQILSWYAFLYCLFAGVLTTVDSLGSEKRENTLGLLFLTDLHGCYDIVLGKQAANSLNCLMGLLAMLPVLAIPILMGGVRYYEFCRAALCLLTTRLLSLAAGFFVSVMSRNLFRAASAGLLADVVPGIWLAAIFSWRSAGLIRRSRNCARPAAGLIASPLFRPLCHGPDISPWAMSASCSATAPPPSWPRAKCWMPLRTSDSVCA